MNVQFERTSLAAASHGMPLNGRVVLSYEFFQRHSQSLGYLPGASNTNLRRGNSLTPLRNLPNTSWPTYTRSSTSLRNTSRHWERAGSNVNLQVNHFLLRSISISKQFCLASLCPVYIRHIEIITHIYKIRHCFTFCVILLAASCLWGEIYIRRRKFSANNIHAQQMSAPTKNNLPKQIRYS